MGSRHLISMVEKTDAAHIPAVLSVLGAVTGEAFSPSSWAAVGMKDSKDVQASEEAQAPGILVTH